MLNKPCILGRTPLNHYVVFFLYDWIQFADILLRIVASVFRYYSEFVLFVFYNLVTSLSSFVIIMWPQDKLKSIRISCISRGIGVELVIFLKYLYFKTALFLLYGISYTCS